MATKIQWTDQTWNPFTGCSKISPACDNCYAFNMTHRLQAMPKTAEKYKNGFTPTFHPEELNKPKSWKKPCRIFVVSMGDIFHEDNNWANIDRVFDVMNEVKRHTYFILTKRPERLKQYLEWYYYLTGRCASEMSNIWIGVTAENQAMADKRIPLLLNAWPRRAFVSIEPMLGPISLLNYLPMIVRDCQYFHDSGNLDWVIVGGETGRAARPMQPKWVKSIEYQCHQSKVPFFFKAWGLNHSHIPDEILNADITRERHDRGRPITDKVGIIIKPNLQAIKEMAGVDENFNVLPQVSTNIVLSPLPRVSKRVVPSENYINSNPVAEVIEAQSPQSHQSPQSSQSRQSK